MESLLLEQTRFSVPAKLDACHIIRDKVIAIAENLPFGDDELDDIKLAVGEAASNAVKHGCRSFPEAEVTVCCWSSDCEMGIEVSDPGEGFNPDTVSNPDFDLLPEGGMGIFYMKQSMDSVNFSFTTGTTVTLTKQFKKG